MPEKKNMPTYCDWRKTPDKEKKYVQKIKLSFINIKVILHGKGLGSKGINQMVQIGLLL
jgi:hypothetical protein